MSARQLTFPKGLFYPRAEPTRVVEQLLALARIVQEAGWEERGGHLIRDAEGKVYARTKWIPRADWWPQRPFPFSENQIAGIVMKRLTCGALTKKESECLQYLLKLAAIANEHSEASNDDWLKGDAT